MQPSSAVTYVLFTSRKYESASAYRHWGSLFPPKWFWVAGRRGPDQAPAIFKPLGGPHAGELIGDALVLTEHVAYFSATYADVVGRHVHIGADMTNQLRYE